MEVGAGVAAGIAGALAGAYLLYARTNPQQKKRTKAWVMKARKAAGMEAKKLSSIGEHEYHRIVEKAMRALRRDEAYKRRGDRFGYSRREIGMEAYPDAGKENGEASSEAASGQEGGKAKDQEAEIDNIFPKQ